MESFPPPGRRKTPKGISLSQFPAVPISSPFLPPNGFWKITLGNLVSMIVIVATIVYAAGRVNERLDSIWSWKESVDKRFEHYDDVGTKALTSHIGVEELKNVEQDRRINNIERQLDAAVPDIREIKTKMEVVTNLLQEQKKLQTTPR